MNIQKLYAPIDNCDYKLLLDAQHSQIPIYLNDGYYICSGGDIANDYIFSLSTSTIIEKLVIEFEYEKTIEVCDIYSLISIEKEENYLTCIYALSAYDLIETDKIKWSPISYFQAIEEEIKNLDGMALDGRDFTCKISDSSLILKIKSPLLPFVCDCIEYANSKLSILHQSVLIALGSMNWKNAYELNERSFSEEILAPLFRKMQFKSVNYCHGKREYGKDFTFHEIDSFGQFKYYAVQVKAGNVSGKVNSEIDEIIGQIADAFQMPYYDVNSKRPIYISTFIIIISGQFTENAKEKILNKTNKGLLGSVYFFDKHKVLELIQQFWTK
jgi:hypothetical protein